MQYFKADNKDGTGFQVRAIISSSTRRSRLDAKDCESNMGANLDLLDAGFFFFFVFFFFPIDLVQGIDSLGFEQK